MSRWWSRLWPFARPDLAGVGVVTSLGVLASLTDALAPWPTKIVLDAVVGGAPLPPWWTWLDRLPGATSRTGLLAWLTAATVVVFLAGWALRTVQVYLQTGIGLRMTHRLGGELFSLLQRLSLRFHGTQPSGDLVNRVTTDSSCVQNLCFDVMVPMVGSIASLGLLFGILWRLDAALALVAVAVAPLVGIAIRLAAAPMERHAYEFLMRQSDILGFAEQRLTGLPLIRAFGREADEAARFESLLGTSDQAYLTSIASQLRFKIGVTSITAVGTALVLALGGFRVLQGRLTAGDLVVVVAYLTALYAPLQSLSYLTAGYASARAGARRVFEILDQDREIRDRPQPTELPARVEAPLLRFEHVTAGYRREQPVLRDVTFEVGPGETVAIVGPTGAGKSTLVSLIPRFIDVTDGRVLFGPHDVRDLRIAALRAQVAIVLQEPFLLPLSVSDNIAYGAPHATREAIEAAARDANAEAFIRRLPDGYDTVLSERGSSLSGGERQRLAIARALLKDAPVLILDEPTSALDAATEGLVLSALERLRQGRTTIVIAHRMSTIQTATRIVVLAGDGTALVGTHQELLRQGGLYAEFCATQFTRPSDDA